MLRGPILTVPLATGRPLSPPPHRSADSMLSNAGDSVGPGACFQGAYVPRGATTSRLHGESVSNDLGEAVVAQGVSVRVVYM